jgi:hypothetical protein
MCGICARTMLLLIESCFERKSCAGVEERDGGTTVGAYQYPVGQPRHLSAPNLGNLTMNDALTYLPLHTNPISSHVQVTATATTCCAAQVHWRL